MASKSTRRGPVVFIGAADVICAQAVQYFAAASEAPLVLADRPVRMPFVKLRLRWLPGVPLPKKWTFSTLLH